MADTYAPRPVWDIRRTFRANANTNAAEGVTELYDRSRWVSVSFSNRETARTFGEDKAEQRGKRRR